MKTRLRHMHLGGLSSSWGMKCRRLRIVMSFSHKDVKASARFPIATPLVYVGTDSPHARNILASVDKLHLHQLQSAFHEVRTILRDQLETPDAGHYVIARLLGRSRGMSEVRRLVEKAVNRDVAVLLHGETGSGKEFIARTLHAASNRSNRAFVPINCESIQPELLASELFGHERGAFQGALTSKPGRLELADGGTLYLEQPSALDYALQLRLLQALRNKEVTRLGADRARPLDIRIIVADQGNLEALVQRGSSGRPLPSNQCLSSPDSATTRAFRRRWVAD